MPDLALAEREVSARDAGERSTPSRGVVATTAVVVGLVLAAQIPIARGVLDPATALGAAGAKGVLKVNALIAAITVLGAAILPGRLRAFAILPGALVTAATLGAAVTAGGHLWDVVMALLTFTGSWGAGRLALRALGVAEVEGIVIVELGVGLGIVGLAVLVLGRLGALGWWSAGALMIAVGSVGAWMGVRDGWARRGALWSTIADSRVATACAGLVLLQLGWAVVWLSAPEIMFDALSAKAYLPQLWAESGSIGPLLAHPMLNVTGLAQFVAVPGHTVNANDVGRDLQLLCWVVLVTTTWWAGRDSAAGPLAALLVGVVPIIVWESTTAYDDLMLAVGAMALAIAVLRVTRPTLGSAIAVGLLAGSCIWLKLNLLAIGLVLLVGWVLLARPSRMLAQRAIGAGLGCLAIAGPTIVLRWIDTGNPVFPTYNTIFKSPHYPLIDEQYDFPYWPQAGILDAIRAPYEAVVHPTLMNGLIPPGTFAMLVAAIVLAVLIGWQRAPGAGGRAASLVVWLAVILSVLAWWVQFRYLRYLLPTAMVAVVLVLTQLRAWRPGRVATGALLLAAGAAATLYLPSTVANYWNVPNRDLPFAAAFGRWDSQDYLQSVFPEKDTLDAFQRIAAPGATAVSNAHERTFLHDRDLSAVWEVERLLELSGPLPTDGDDALHRLRRLGIGWALLSGPERSGEGSTWLTSVLAQHGEPAFSDRGWDLYRLVDRPARPRLTTCDSGLTGRPGCWTGTFDARAGLSDGESDGGVSRTIPVCGGETVTVDLTTTAEGQSAQVWLNADNANPRSGHSGGTVPAGRRGRVIGTAPPGAHAMSITLVPGIDSGQIVRARVGLLGRCSPSPR